MSVTDMPGAYRASDARPLRKFAPAFMLALTASCASLFAVTYDSQRGTERVSVSIPAPEFAPNLVNKDLSLGSDDVVSDLDMSDLNNGFGAKALVVPEKIPGQNVAALRSVMDTVGFDLDAVRQGGALVPRVLTDAIPYDLASVSHTPDKKRDFIRMMLPMILATNEAVARDRARAIALQKQMEAGKTPTIEQLAWLEDQFAEYNTGSGDFKTLLTRLDTIPPSLVLAQAAIESGWGSSRFAREGNALFGQWTTSEHRGIVPASRDEGKTHKIRAFDTPAESVESYFRNLNTHRAYRDLRAARAVMRGVASSTAELPAGSTDSLAAPSADATDTMVDSMRLADTLIAYSEKGQDYVDLLKSVIRINALQDFDGSRLAPDTPAALDTNA